MGRTVLELPWETGDSLPQWRPSWKRCTGSWAGWQGEAELEELLARQGQLQSQFEQLVATTWRPGPRGCWPGRALTKSG